MFHILCTLGLSYMFQRSLYSDTYSNEVNDAGLAGNTKAKYQDFAGNLTYYVAKQIGYGDDKKPLYVFNPHVVDSNDLVREAMLFVEHVTAGRAYTTHTLPSTTTTTTTVAPTTTTTTVP